MGRLLREGGASREKERGNREGRAPKGTGKGEEGGWGRGEGKGDLKVRH